MSEIRVTGRPGLNRGGKQNVTEAQARQNNYGAAPPAPSSTLTGLVQGLSVLNPALASLASDYVVQQRDAVDAQAKADAQRAENPVDALTGEPTTLPETVSPAFDAAYRHAFGGVVAQRAALEMRNETVRTYEEQKDTEGFDPEKFLTERRQLAMAGIRDPRLANIVGGHVTEVEAQLRADATKAALERHEEQRMVTASALAGSAFGGDMDAGEILRKHQEWFVPQMGSIQVQPKQAAALLFARLKTLSDERGGDPTVFDAMTMEGTDNLTLLNRNPALADHVASAREQAVRKRDKRVHEATEPWRASLYSMWDSMVLDSPENVTLENLTPYIAANGLSAKEAASYMHQAKINMGKGAALKSIQADAISGHLGKHDPKVQEKFIDGEFAGEVDRIWNVATSKVPGEPGSLNQLVDQMMQRFSPMNASIPIDALTRLMTTTVSTLPNPDGPDEKFKATAAIYSAMEQWPQHRGMYFKGDADEVMSAYVRHTTGGGEGTDPKLAYTAAYRSISPEQRKRNAERARDPDMRNKARKAATSFVEGSSPWGWLGGNGRPENASTLDTWALGEMQRQMELNPDLPDAELVKAVERESQNNFVLDTTSQYAIKIPPKFAGPLTQEAFTAFSTKLGQDLTKAGEFPKGSVIRYEPKDSAGNYNVQVWQGSYMRVLDGELRIQTVVDMHRATTLLSKLPEKEKLLVQQAREALRTGKPLPDLPQPLLAHVHSSGYFTDRDKTELEARTLNDVATRIKAQPDLGFGRPTLDNTAPPQKGSGQVVDHKATRSVALFLADPKGTARGQEHFSWAGSLIAMREGVSLKAHPDPNKEAGNNIGAGYNLAANAKYVDKDLRKIGVPESRIADVKEGRASLSPQQVQSLIQVTLPRYIAHAEKAAEEATPGLWRRMSEAQKAVMVDIAYQAGPAGVAKYKKAWAALAAGDTAAFQAETKMFYRKDKDSPMVEDKRANDLRASMLAGIAHWNARISN